MLLPEIHAGNYVVMDNLRTHHCKGVEDMIRSKRAIPLYLPPYSPDLNLFERMWSKMKAILRKFRIRVKKILFRLLIKLLLASYLLIVRAGFTVPVTDIFYADCSSSGVWSSRTCKHAQRLDALYSTHVMGKIG